MAARTTKSVAFLGLLISLAAGIFASQTAMAQNFISFDYPGATQTTVTSVNNKGVMAGYYADPTWHGFVLQNGAFTQIDFPAAQWTKALGINDNGDIVGYYADGTTAFLHGFLFSKGVYTTLDPPDSVVGETIASGINNIGQIVGYYDGADGNQHGFLWTAGVYSTIDFPGSSLTFITSIDNAGAMAGFYGDPFPNYSGFLYQNGTFSSPIRYPGASDTELNGINDSGQIVGYAYPSVSGGFVYDSNSGKFTDISVPGATSSQVFGISDIGQLVAGSYSPLRAGSDHGFVSATGPFAYVANLGSDTVSMIDIPTSLPVTAIPTGSEPWGVAISPNGKQVYVSNYIGNSVSVIDTASNTVVATIPGLSSPRGLAFTPDGTWVYVANPGVNNVSVIDTTLHTVVATVPVADAIGVAMALTSNGTFAYATNANGSVSVIAVGSTPTVVQTIPVGSLPIWVAVTPNSSLAYVMNQGSNNISVISVASNTVTATIPVGTNPNSAAFTPDSRFAYVTNSGSNTVSVIDTATNSVVKTVSGFNIPYYVALTTDGAFAYVTNLLANVSVIDTASNTITGTVAVGSDPYGVAIASAPQTELQITQPLSPTQPTVFNFGTNNYVVQYPPGTSFSNVLMTVTDVPITQAQFQQRVAGTIFASAACIVYGGTGGNCVDHQVACSDNNGNPITCPIASAIDVQTNFTTSQSIVNPGYLTTPINQNQWQNIFTELVGIGPHIKVKGITTGFSEFVAADLGAGNPQGQAQSQILSPIFPVTYSQGQVIPISIQLTSVVPPNPPVTDAHASISVVMIANANGNPVQQVVFSKTNAFTQGTSGVYKYNLDASAYAAGTYNVTIYGDAFPAYQGQFQIQAAAGSVVLVARPTSLTFPLQQVGTFSAALRDSLFNEGTVKGVVSSVQTTGDFQLQTNHCTNGVKPATHCDVYIVFSPTAVGMRTGTLSYYDNAAGSPQTVLLSGVGTLNGAAVTLSPTSLSFGKVVINTTSAAKTVTLTNSGAATLNISSIATSGIFAMSSKTCGTTLPVGAKCIVKVTFTPTVLGSLTGTLTFTDNAPNSPQTVSLSGTGVVPAKLTPATATYVAQTVGTTSAPKTFTLTNNQTVALNSIAISTTGDFAVSAKTCTTSLAAKGKCTISVTFRPTVVGTRKGTLSVSDSASNSPQASNLTGTGK